MRAGISVNLHGDGHLTSIGARFETRKCPDWPGETAAKLLHAQEDDSIRKAPFRPGLYLRCLARDVLPRPDGQPQRPSAPTRFGKHGDEVPGSIKQERDLEPGCGLGIRCTELHET